MRYTRLGQRGPTVSRLGFGCMRLPMTKEGKVDRELAIPMLRRAVDLGINYFDSAIFYCNGDSQRTIGEAMEDRRDRVVLSTKNHLYEAPDDVWWSRLVESLDFLRTDHIDCYCFHGMTWETYQKHVGTKTGKLRLMEKARAEGKIRHICCSFHDSPEALVKLIETGTFTAITLQYNLLNRSLEEAMHRARECGVGIVVMGPVGGGRLGVQSERIQELTRNEAASTPEAALRFVLAHPAVCVALSGMSSMQMLEENVRAVSDKDPFTAGQIAAIDQEVTRVKERLGVLCTACGYCQPCPFGVDIPGSFSVYNEYKMFGLTDHSRAAYSSLVKPAAACTECGACLKKCPQKLEIPATLRKVMSELDKEYGEFGSILSIRSVTDAAITAGSVARPDSPGKRGQVHFACRPSGCSAQNVPVPFSPRAATAGQDRQCHTGEVTVQAQVTVKNLRPEPIRPHVHIELEDGCTSEPMAVDFREVKAFGSASHQVAITVPDGVGILAGKCVTSHEEEARETPLRIAFFAIPRETLRWHAAKVTPKDFSGNEEAARAHGYRVGLRHDDERIFIELDVRSQMHGLSRKGEAGGGRFELYVDMRPPELITTSYEFGAEQLFLCLDVPEFGTKSGNAYSLNMVTERTRGGCRITLELPFAAFMKSEWGKPKTIGLDWMFVAAAADGTEYGHPTYGGRQGLWQNPRLFTTAYLL